MYTFLLVMACFGGFVCFGCFSLMGSQDTGPLVNSSAIDTVVDVEYDS